MRTIYLKSFLTICILIATYSLTKAQADADGCKDHQLFSRLQNFVIESCQTNYNAIDIQIGSGSKTRTEDGNVTTLRYSFNTESGAKMPSPVQIIKNYENAIVSKGGKKEYQGVDDIDGGVMGAVFSMSVSGKNYWVVVRGMYEPAVNGEVGAFTLIVIEKEAMKQEIEANAMFQKINSGDALTLYINFETGKSSIKSESQNIIDELYKMLSENPSLKITIEGHTDNVGNPTSNKTLSEQRAISVKTALVNKGISEDRIKTIGYGQDKPITDNSTEAGKAKNRRVEIKKQ